MELGKKPLTKSDARDARRRPPRLMRFRFRPNAVENGLFQKARSDMQSGCLATSRSERARPMPVYSWED